MQATDITEDTNWLLAKADAENTALSVRYAKEAARFDHVPVDAVTRRKLYLLKQSLTLPAPSRPGAAAGTGRQSPRGSATAYSTAKLVYKGKTLTLDDMEEILRTSRDPDETRALWEGWRASSSPQMKADYARWSSSPTKARASSATPTPARCGAPGTTCRPDDFAAKTDALWDQVAPLYKKLHCYVRARLNEKYGDAVQPAHGPIRADLTRQYVGAGLGQHLRHGRAEGRTARLRPDRSAGGPRLRRRRRWSRPPRTSYHVDRLCAAAGDVLGALA